MEDRPRSAPSQEVPPRAIDGASQVRELDSANCGEQPPHDGDSSVAPVWLQRVSLVMLVLFCVYLGILVAVLPWLPRFWDHNMFINSYPALAAVLHNGAVRGLISGLGLIDIWIGISEAIHYRDHRA
ncbi:MAG TPA: hypothetical protein VN612_00915 [Acidobacteriaceae bacterium]|nr:hypothetical protein [Acidobacteriaceae bacterium]